MCGFVYRRVVIVISSENANRESAQHFCCAGRERVA
jgi:hypothetical protein